MTKKQPDTKESEHELVAAAMNEQGFLLQQRLSHEISLGKGGLARWEIAACEFPVSVAKFHTRIDLVLRNKKDAGIHLVIEAKRSNPLYKRWVFFGDASSNGYFERAEGFTKLSGENLTSVHRVDRVATGIPAYSYYLEALEHRTKDKSSATEATEQSLRQATLGQVGLMQKLLSFGNHAAGIPPNPTIVVPVVVTTARLHVAQFDAGAIPLETGALIPSALTLTEKNYLAVHYRLDDEIANSAELSTCDPTSIEDDLTGHKLRTAFIVSAPNLSSFLEWFHDNLVSNLTKR